MATCLFNDVTIGQPDFSAVTPTEMLLERRSIVDTITVKSYSEFTVITFAGTVRIPEVTFATLNPENRHGEPKSTNDALKQLHINSNVEEL